jgi:hypothetical protein
VSLTYFLKAHTIYNTILYHVTHSYFTDEEDISFYYFCANKDDIFYNSLRYTSWFNIIPRRNHSICGLGYECFWKNSIWVRIKVIIFPPAYLTSIVFLHSFFADYLGHVNIIILYSIISGLANLVLWSYAKTFGSVIAFSIVFGFFGGAFITLSK